MKRLTHPRNYIKGAAFAAPVFVQDSWLRGGDLNPRPLGYEPNELPDLLHPAPRAHHRSLRGKTLSSSNLPRPTAGSRMGDLLFLILELWRLAISSTGLLEPWVPGICDRCLRFSRVAPGSFHLSPYFLHLRKLLLLPQRPLRTEIRFHTGLWAHRRLASKGWCFLP